MAILINFKICDNPPDCSWIAACPNNALCFDKEKDSLVINNDACVSCNRCVKSCLVGAIKLAKNQEEYDARKKEIDNDPRTSKGLFVDRYWAVPISTQTLLDPETFEKTILMSKKLMAVELFNDDSIECLIKSNPIKELFPKDISYYKFLADNIFLEQYKIKKLPALLFFNDWKVIGTIEWFYSTEKKNELINEIDKILKHATFSS